MANKLAERGRSTTGLKAVLVESLEEAIAEDEKKEVSKSKRKGKRYSSDGGGTKKEFLERLCNDASNGFNAPIKSDGAEDDENGFQVEKDDEKIITATKKGAAVLDQWILDHIESQYHVLQRDEDVYDAMLNQTNVRITITSSLSYKC